LEQERLIALQTQLMEQLESSRKRIILDGWIMAGIGIGGLIIGYLLGGLK
jgi:hypothetical protein